MKLEVGKRYVMRNGEVTGALECCENLSGWFKDSRNTWREDGLWSSADVTGAYDIVAEYVESQPQQPLRWVENCKPDKPGIWAWRYDTSRTTRPTKVVDLSEDDCQNCSTNGIEWCYLGPIPEILSPKKKVVERLWLLKVRDITRSNCAEYSEHWLGYNKQPTESGDWIRTNRTREREI